MEILEIVKLLPPAITDDEQDDLLNLYIEIITQRILNYCSINELPVALKYTVAQMVKDMTSDTPGIAIIEGTGKPSSVSEEGRTVSFDVSQKIVQITNQTDERISKMKEVNKFKQLYAFRE